MIAPEFWPAPAKLNLMLRVVGRRSDGYHLLQTVFQFLDIGDELRFAVRHDPEIRRVDVLPGVSVTDDLVYRAASLLQRETGCVRGADIALTKRLPMGGGLGGGSSDAATTLVALNRLWGTGRSEDDLAGLGVRLGADVPVFVRGHAAWGEGVGDRLTPVRLPESRYLVVCPDVAVSTAAVFKDPELTRNSSPITIADFLAGSQGNDCLEVVERRYPQVREARRSLAPWGEGRLTGTGGCVFVALTDESAVRTALVQPPTGAKAFMAQGLNRSPLKMLLDSLTDEFGEH